MPKSPPPESLGPAEVVGYVLADLALILVAVWVTGWVFERLRQPRIAGEIVGAVLIGPTVLGGQLARSGISELDRPPVAGEGLVNDIFPLQAFEVLNGIATLAVVAFMFLIGLEVSRRYLRGEAIPILAVAMATVAVPVGIGFVLANILDTLGEWKVQITPEGRPVTFPTHALFVGAAFAVTAFPVVARLLQQRRVLATRQGRIALGAAVATAPLAFVIIATASASIRQQGVPGNVAVKVALAIGLLVVLFGLVRPLMRLLIGRLFRPGEPLSDALLAVLVLGMLASALASHRIGIHAFAGGFIFGACIPYVDGFERAVLDRLRRAIAIFGIPVFLGVVGLQTDFRVLDLGLLGGLAAFVCALVVGKWAVGAIAGRAVGLSWLEGAAAGALLNVRGTMILVVALLGLQSGVLAPMMVVALVTGAIVTTLMTGPLLNRLVPSETIEVRLEQTVARALAGVPAAADRDRVVVAPIGASSATAAFTAALDRCDEGGGTQFLLLGLPGLDPDGVLIGAGPSEVRSAVLDGKRELELGADALRSAGADVWVTVFQSPEPAVDLARLSAEFGASAAIVGGEAEADALAEAGIKVERVGLAAL